MRFDKHHRHCSPEPHPTVTTASTGLEDSPILENHQLPGMPPVVPRIAAVQRLPPGGSSIARYSPLPPAPAKPGDDSSTASAHADMPVPPPLVLRPSKPIQRFPEKKPPEIRVLLDSQAKRIPLLIILSRDCALMPFDLPPEYAYSYLGLFFVSDIRAELADFSETPGTDAIRGRVRWRLTLEWAPGGEKALFTRADDRTRPWWVSKSPDTGSSESDSTLSRYRPRDLNDHYYSFLPLDLLAKFTPSENFPRGWWCRDCGLVNAQRYLRHQICGSSSCKALSDDGKYKGLADSLQALRDPHHTLPLLMPQDSAPPEVPTVVSSWEDSMRTIVYEVNENAAVKHIFTGNQQDPQEEPTQLLQAIQQDVLILRREYSSPYFTHLTTAAALCDAEAIPWFGAPPCIVQARDLMLHYAHVYGETEEADINEVLTQAWVTAGSKKGRVFRARDSPIMLLSLGAEVTLNLVPKGGFGEPHDDEIDANPRQAPSRKGPPPFSMRPAIRPTESSRNRERNDWRLPSPVFAAYAHNDSEQYAPPEHPPDPDGEMDMEISDGDETVADPEPWSCMTVDPPLEPPMHPVFHIADALPNHDADDPFFPLSTTAASAHRDLQHMASSRHRVAPEGGLHMDITYDEARIDPEPLNRSPMSSGDAAIVLMEHKAPITSTGITAGEAPSQSASLGEPITTISTGGLMPLSWPPDATTRGVQMSEDDLGGSGLVGANIDLVDHSTLRGSTTEFAYPISGLSATIMGTRQSDSRELTFHTFKDVEMGDGGAVAELTSTGARLIEPSTTLNQFTTDIQPETAPSSVLPGTVKLPPHGISPSPIATKGRGEQIEGVRTRGRAKRKAQQTTPELSVTLVHGDGLLLMGDDFEESDVSAVGSPN
ncbi:hypothetical protein BV22DRAFT_860635 [Leucogyrophana mollusca]|uniref:Uncharacterized protein n=1 Tax=Leucogyrophana mollusca TaxID=85980 RepID=A0ACB8B229_9AGAM|nr:hypothetical protein BV22DRAFT_860635 [Leucogyrophana mollusca]